MPKKKDVFQGEVDSFSKEELAEIINNTLGLIDHYVECYPEESSRIKEIGKNILEMIIDKNTKHIEEKLAELECVDNLIETTEEELSAEEKAARNKLN